jgi:hypothetical protein
MTTFLDSFYLAAIIGGIIPMIILLYRELEMILRGSTEYYGTEKAVWPCSINNAN